MRRLIRLVLADVDGTLLTDDKVLTEPAIAAARALRAAGIVLAIISARPPRGMRMLIEPLGITTPLCGFNGAVIAGPDFSIIAQHLLTPEIARHAVAQLDASRLQVWVFAGHDWLVRDAGQPYVGFEQRTVSFAPTVVEDFGAALDNAAKIVGVSRDFAKLARCEVDMRTTLAGQASVVRSQSYYLDITHPLANKGAALSAIAELLAIAPDQIVAIGDGRNDVAMFERSGFAIAMGNASDEVKARANVVTDRNDNDGFAKAVQEFVLGVPQRGTDRAAGVGV
ncbi:MAG: Cof-type HAD-IIB family hydrolase [Rhodospirillales bacterium]